MESASNYEHRRIMGKARNRVQIPAFGEWNFVSQDSIPITHYFERCMNTTNHAYVYPYPIYRYYDAAAAAADDLFHSQHYNTSPQHRFFNYNQLQLHSPSLNMRQVKGDCGTQRRQQRRSRLENKKRVFDVTSTEAHYASATLCRNDAISASTTTADVDKFHNVKKSGDSKAKDEDLYKIPPELIHKFKPKKKMSKFFSKCFVTICTT